MALAAGTRGDVNAASNHARPGESALSDRPDVCEDCTMLVSDDKEGHDKIGALTRLKVAQAPLSLGTVRNGAQK